MNYADVVTTLSTLTAIVPTDADFLAVLPACFNDAEGRIFRDLDMINLDVRDGSGQTTAGSRNFNLPTSVGVFQVVSAVNIITPAGSAPDSGTRNPCRPCSLDLLDYIYGSSAGAGVPSMYAYISQSSISDQKNIIFAPWPDSNYRVEVVGKIQWPTLSVSNTSTFLTLYLPDVFIAACMVFMTGYMKNWGAQSDDPRSAMSWETHYNSLLESAGVWEARKRMAGASWTPKPVEPMAQPQRG